MSRSKTTDEQLREASEWLIYEIWMFRGLAKGMAEGEEAGKGVYSNAILDSFLMHTRALLSFFYAHNPHTEDVIAEHYFLSAEEKWGDIRPQIENEEIREIKDKISKRVAHISYKRQKDTWELPKIIEMINPAIDKFLSVVPTDKLGPRWDGFKQEPDDSGEIIGILSLPPHNKGGHWWSIAPSSFYWDTTHFDSDWYPDT